jgi:hypothetical protein
MPSCLFRKFKKKKYTKTAFLLLKISIDVYDLSINRLHHKILHLLYGLSSYLQVIKFKGN